MFKDVGSNDFTRAVDKALARCSKIGDVCLASEFHTVMVA